MKTRFPRFVIYLDAAGEWRWRLKAANGRTVADSGESYTKRASCVRAANRIAATMGARTSVYTWPHGGIDLIVQA